MSTSEPRAPSTPEGDARGTAATATARLGGNALILIGSLAVLAMLLNIVIDVLMRFLFNDPITGTLELTTYYYMIAIAFMGAFAAQQRVEHIEVTVLVDRLSGTSRLYFSVVADVVTLAFLAALVWYGWNVALASKSEGEVAGATQVLTWPARFLVPVGLAAFGLQLLVGTIRAIRRGTPPEHEPPEEGAIL